MRSRVERVARAEQREFVEKELSARVDRLLQRLTREITLCASAWAAQLSASPRKESTSCLGGAASLAWEGWSDAELASVRSTMTEVHELVGLHVVRFHDSVAATLGSEANVTRGFSEAAAAGSTGDASETKGSSSPFYEVFVRQLINRLVFAVTSTTISSVVPSACTDCVRGAAYSEDGDAVIPECFVPCGASSLFPAQSVLRLPASIYIGWRCGYSLLDSIGDTLRVTDGDREAGWLDLTSAALCSLVGCGGAHGSAPSPAVAPDTGVALHNFLVSAKTQMCTLQCWWWWCSLVFEHGCSRGWLTTISSAPSPGHAQGVLGSTKESPGPAPATAPTTAGDCGRADGATLDIFVAAEDDYRSLWDLGCAEAAAYLSAIVLPSVVHFLHAVVERFVLIEPMPSLQQCPDPSWRFREVVRTVRSVADGFFPSPPQTTNIASSGTPPSHSPPLTAATDSFLRHAVHDALLPLAERVLDNPDLLQSRRVAWADAADTAAPAASVKCADEGWGSGDDSEWGEVQMTGSATVHSSSAGAPTSAAAPPIKLQSTLAYALDVLESELGGIVSTDSVAMTLLRL
ncbi:hypothetical protein JKF63_06770 [Porcisia hertigi]|uniref:Uncharacterized protein n=1 Tax=Porcisia hertigi TaxID=2761500 RepID=A0A836IPI9_9TRYP|nr:hypothetical protein JKF63_06770 [Porcisia hertigi]